MKPIFFIGGGKGGVGKSKLSFALINYFYTKKMPVLVVDTDNSNPDVFKAHLPFESDDFEAVQLNLDDAEGWIELVNKVDEADEHIVIINSAARNKEGIEKYSSTLKESLAELERELITLWIINRQRDSVQLLRDYIREFTDSKTHVLLNNYFGETDKFDYFQDTKVKTTIEEKKGLILNFPKLADRVADQLYTQRIPIFEGMKKFKIGDRAELKRWVKLCDEIFSQVYVG